MAYKVIILYQLYMPSYFLGTFTEYPQISDSTRGYFAFLDTLFCLERQTILINSKSYLLFEFQCKLHFFLFY